MHKERQKPHVTMDLQFQTVTSTTRNHPLKKLIGHLIRASRSKTCRS
jgi:hypothetical protein